MRRSRPTVTYVGTWMLASFLAGTLAGMLLMTVFRDTSPLSPDEPTMSAPPRATAIDETKAAGINPVLEADPPSNGVRPSLDDAIDELRDRDLLVPVQGVTRKMLRDSFDETRDKIREHEAMDILAPRSTPVLAVDDGPIVKFFTSVRGGLTIYQFDQSRTYCYYYAHLQGYASGLSEGDQVKRGQTIGFVGTTGNAPPDTPHLHFAIFFLTDEKLWWKGTAINPFDVWKK